jgi:hypothetical protein
MKDVIIYDNFYEDPDIIRETALETFKKIIDVNNVYDKWHFNEYKGKFDDIPGLIKEKKPFIGSKFETSSFFDIYHEKKFEELLNAKIQYTSEKNGIFILESCLSAPISVVINKNNIKASYIEEWVGIIFLTPNAPIEGGLTIQNYKKLNTNSVKTFIEYDEPIKTIILTEMEKCKIDKTYWDIDSQIANVYNRLILLKKNILYSTSLNFGINLNDSRLIHFFSFSVTYN